MSAIDERREELMRFHASDLRALARLKHVNLGDARTKRDIANEIAVAEFYRARNGIKDFEEGE